MATSQELRSEWEKLLREANDFAGGQQSYSDLLEKKYNEKVNFNKDLIEAKNRLQEEQFTTPTNLRAEYFNSPIRNPLAQEKIISDRRGNIGVSLGSTIDLLNARGMSMRDILDRANAGYATELGGKQRAADLAAQLYKDQQDEERYQEALRRSGGGGGGGYVDPSMYGEDTYMDNTAPGGGPGPITTDEVDGGGLTGRNTAPFKLGKWAYSNPILGGIKAAQTITGQVKQRFPEQTRQLQGNIKGGQTKFWQQYGQGKKKISSLFK